MEQKERRMYQRGNNGNNFTCTARISEGGLIWFESNVVNLSSGGLLFASQDIFRVGTILWFDMFVEGFFSDFKLETRGRVCRIQNNGRYYNHGTAFLDLDDEMKTEIDVNVNSDKRLCVNYNTPETLYNMQRGRR